MKKVIDDKKSIQIAIKVKVLMLLFLISVASIGTIGNTNSIIGLHNIGKLANYYD